MMNNIDVKKLEEIIKLMENYKLDVLEIEGIKLVKTKHEYPAFQPKAIDQDEDLLLWSAKE
jgi:hypothetical protein